jgi:anhydro-N-acetylmuramic acid kinase
MEEYIGIGLMSGTSLDGLDIAACKFHMNNGSWNYEFIACETIEYDDSIRLKLEKAMQLPADELCRLDFELGVFFGNQTREFINKHGLNPDYIASHGHTIFHKPDQGYTLQIGSLNEISIRTKTRVIGDFRSLDVALGGQGAPLVPIGDDLLYSEYDSCLNLGGIANFSFSENGIRKAWDLSPFNQVFDDIMKESYGLNYDPEGTYASEGKVSIDLLNELNDLDFYKKRGAKSLGREWVNKEFKEVLSKYKLSPKDQLATLSQHYADIISTELKPGKVLVTGGGAYNTHFINLLKKNKNLEIIIPDTKVIEYKEAMIFAFLGVLRIKNQINVLKSVTGAREDSCSGVIIVSE